MGIPPNSVNCWFVSAEEAAMALRDSRPFCEYVNPYNYFLRTRRINRTTLEGYIGHQDAVEEYHGKLVTNYTYFKDHSERKKIYFTFDRSVLYQVTDIYPSNPLLFTLQQVTNLLINQSMISQEDIYKLLLNEKWAEILTILYKHRTEISNEPILKHAAQTFENVFIQKVKDIAIDNAEMKEVLEHCYILHHGKFYLFGEENIKTITIELGRRTPLKQGYDYAKQYPEEEIAKKVIEQYKKEHYSLGQADQNRFTISYNWVEIFNRLFELINVEKDGITYFSGPRFIKVVKQVSPYHPGYEQYIELRNTEGKSTSRKIYFYDILMDNDEHSRQKIVNIIIEVVRPYFPDKVRAIEMLMGKESVENAVIQATKTNGVAGRRPVVFISYSWDDDEHNAWVLRLAEKLVKSGIEVILDKYKLSLGKSLPHFIEQSIASANRILIIFTPNYRLKADKRSGGVGYEYSIMNNDLYNNQTMNDKVIPVLRKGNMQESIPSFMQQYIHLDLREDANFEARFTELIRDIYNDPAIKPPEIGSKPAFS
jgi:hypothetical protein